MLIYANTAYTICYLFNTKNINFTNLDHNSLLNLLNNKIMKTATVDFE